MNLELKQLSCYLPYGLKMLNVDSRRIYELKGVYDDSDHSVPSICYVFKGERSHFNIMVPQFKPILRPMSELTKEVMERIYANLYAPPQYPDYCECETIGFNGKEFTYTFEGDISYDGGYEFERTTQILSNQYDLINELFKMHFDYFGLIEAGLAIDINKLNNPS